MSAAWVKVGAKVVCVNDSPSRKNGVLTRHLVLGATYVIQSVQVERLRDPRTAAIGDLVTIKLLGVATPTGYVVGRFRPVAPIPTKADDIALFTHHLEMGELLTLGGSTYRSLGRV
jgi:hypothetical protein